jgi:DNA polymerase-1
MIYLVSNQKRIEDKDIRMASIQDCLEYCRGIEEICIDTETEGFDSHSKKVISMQLGDYNNQYFIDWSSIDPSVFISLFTDKTKTFIFQNAKFDLQFLYHNNLTVENIYDTFLAECLLTAGYSDSDRDVSLKGIAKKYLDVELDKEIRGKIHSEGISDRVIIYGCNDVKYLGKIKELQLLKIKEYELENVLNLENEVVKVFAKMEYTGVRVDVNKWTSIADKASKIRDDIEVEMDALIYKLGTKHLPDTNSLTKYCRIYKQGNLFFDDVERDTIINWKSNSQKLQLLKELGLDVDSVGDIIMQRNKNNHPIVPLLISYSKHNKLADAFGMNFLKHINPNTGRVHYNVWQILATGRISVSEPNLNQIPSHGDFGKEIRSAFISRDGYKIVGGDYSGMELRIIAEFSQDPTWIDAFNNGEDLHSKLCAMTFNIPIEDVKKPFPPKPTFTYRDVQKTLNFGLSYGMSEYKLADTIQISVDDAKKLIKKFFSRVPAVSNFLTQLGELGKTRGYIRTGNPYRRIRFFPEWKTYFRNYKNERLQGTDFKDLGSIERKSKNSPIQGTNADVIKRALCLVQKEIDTNNYPVNILLSVYDEIQTECREDFAEEWCKRLEILMVQAAQESIKTVPIIAECSINDCWTK